MRPNGYWPDGNIKKIFDATTSQQIATYEYDAQGQLLSESTPSGTCDYTYDTVGNLLTVQSGSNIVTYTYGDLQWRDRLTRIEFNDREYAISYSGGNPLNWYNGSLYTNLTWGKDRQLVSLKKGTSTYSYSYDMDGIRKSKTVSGVTHNYLTQNGKVVQESYGTKVLQFVYDTAGAPYALRYSTDSGGSWYTFYYILNLQGDVVKLIYANGMACATYSYNAWGECSATTLSTSPVANIANINPLRYRGYYFDSETEFYYLQSRYYDPIVKRFLNADSFASTGQGFLGYNMFAYCNNNPVVFSDESGYSLRPTTTVCNDCATGCIYAGSNSVTVFYNSDENWIDAADRSGLDFCNAIGADSYCVIPAETNSFLADWGHITSRYVLIEVHGTPTKLCTESSFCVRNSEVEMLPKNTSIKCVIITACSSGREDSEEISIAREFSKKIDPAGIVICATRKVFGNGITFTPDISGAWIIYQNGQFIPARLHSTLTMSYAAELIS